MWGMLNPRVIDNISRLASNDNLGPIIEANPKLYEKPLKPFIQINLNPTQRAQLIASHFEILEQAFGENVSKLYLSPYSLLEMADRNGELYSIEVFPGKVREGVIGLQLTERSTGYTIYSITLSIFEQGDIRTMHIGCLQGSTANVENAPDKIKELTRTMHGLRPKALMVELALMLARYLEVNNVSAISNNGHIYQAARYIGSKKGSVAFSYDELWQEFEGTAADRYSFELPTKLARKDPQSLKKTKRRLYTKRYEWLDNLETQFVEQLDRLKK